VSRALVAGVAAAVGVAAVLAAGYAAGGTAGLLDAATVATVAGLVLARARVRGGKPPAVRPKSSRRYWKRRPEVSTADFPAYGKIASDLSWAQVSGRQYDRAMRPMLARLAATLDGRQAVAADLGRPPGDDSGVDLATLERIITRLEEP
jgi:hypothetical protein